MPTPSLSPPSPMTANASSALPFSADRVLAMLDERGAAQQSHGPERSLNDHLRGTMKILLHWGQPEAIVAAGLLHSVYSTDVYQSRLIPFADRAKVAAVAGEDAERLAYLFCTIRRDRLFERLPEIAEGGSEGGAEAVFDAATGSTTGVVANEIAGEIIVECHQGPPTQRISRNELGALLILYMANAAEQTQADDHGPGLWVARASDWGSIARALGADVPPVFHSCSAQVSSGDERAGRRTYLQGTRSFDGRRKEACVEFVEAAAALPWMAEPFLFLACSELFDQEWSKAFQHAATALKLFDEWGMAWDKRLPFQEWKGAAGYIKDCAEWGFTEPGPAGRLVSEIEHESGRDWVSLFGGLAAGLHATALPARLQTYLEGFAAPTNPPKQSYYPGLRSRASYDAGHFPLATALESAYEEIRAEFHGLRGGFNEEVERIARTGSWDVFMLYELGKRNEENCARCPVTAAVVERYASVNSCSGAVYFSVMAPHSRIAAHKGPTNMRVRCHLGIDVPEGCGLRVGDGLLRWEEGKAIVFNDALTHEVWNDSDRPRAVLVADLWHPDLDRDETAFLDGLQRYTLAHAKDMASYWVQNERARSRYAKARP